jgi:type 1 glutamine amidotransferase
VSPDVVLWARGPFHPYRRQAAWFRELAARQGLTLAWSRSVDVLEPASIEDVRAVIIAGAHWRDVTSLSVDAWIDGEPVTTVYDSPSDDGWSALRSRVASGSLGLLVFHAGIGSFDDRPDFASLIDGRWIHGQSSHTEIHRITVVPTREHSIVRDLPAFSTHDEFWDDIVLPRESVILLTVTEGGRSIPVAWSSREDEQTRRIAITLGHDMRTCSTPAFSTFVSRSIAWLANR